MKQSSLFSSPEREKANLRAKLCFFFHQIIKPRSVRGKLPFTIFKHQKLINIIESEKYHKILQRKSSDFCLHLSLHIKFRHTETTKTNFFFQNIRKDQYTNWYLIKIQKKKFFFLNYFAFLQYF